MYEIPTVHLQDALLKDMEWEVKTDGHTFYYGRTIGRGYTVYAQEQRPCVESDIKEFNVTVEGPWGMINYTHHDTLKEAVLEGRAVVRQEIAFILGGGNPEAHARVGNALDRTINHGNVLMCRRCGESLMENGPKHKCPSTQYDDVVIYM